MLIAGVLPLAVAAEAVWLVAASFAVLLVLTTLMGVPYGSVSIAPNPGGCTRPPRRRTGERAAGTFQTCRDVGAFTATVMIGIFYDTGVNFENWSRVVLVILAPSP